MEKIDEFFYAYLVINRSRSSIGEFRLYSSVLQYLMSVDSSDVVTVIGLGEDGEIYAIAPESVYVLVPIEFGTLR